MYFSVVTYGQSEYSIREIVEKVDSIAEINKIDHAKIYINKVSSLGGETETRKVCIAKKQKFYFDRIFLVMDNMYFNLNKLLYFVVEEDYIEFYFQAY